MSLKHKVVFNTIIQFGGRFLTSFVGFLTTLILARYLGSYNYGVYAKIYTLAAFFYLFIDFGLNAVYVRKYKEEFRHIGQIFVLRTAFFAVSLIVILLFLFGSGNLIFTNQEKIWSLLFAPTILLFGYYTTLNIIFQLKMRYDLSVIASVIGGVVGLIMLIALIRFGLIFGILSVVVGYFITVVISYVLAKRIVKINFQNWLIVDRQRLLTLLKESLPLGVMLFLNTMYTRVDVFVLSAMKGDAAVGVYQLGYKFFEFPLAFAAFFANAVFPHYVKVYSGNRPYFRKLFKTATIGLLLSSLVFSLGGFVIAPYLSLIKADYASSAIPLRILVLSYPVFFLTSAMSWLLFVEHKEKHLIWVYGLSFIINIIANILLVPCYSYFASSWITVFGEVLVLMFLVLLVRKKT